MPQPPPPPVPEPSQPAQTPWRVRLAPDSAAAYAVLAQDRIWNGYAIADLLPPFREYARVWLAQMGVEPPCAALLILRHPGFTAMIPHGPAEAVSALLTAADLPDRTFVLARAEHLAALSRHFDGADELQTMLRMSLTPDAFSPNALATSAAPGAEVLRLAAADVQSLHDLYADYPASAFQADQLTAGPFFGVRDNAGGLAAAGGVHVVARDYQIAAIGNIFVRPEARGHGHGEAITRAIVSALFRDGCHDLILNVAADNTPAQRIYRRLGFTDYCRYHEGVLQRRQAATGSGGAVEVDRRP